MADFAVFAVLLFANGQPVGREFARGRKLEDGWVADASVDDKSKGKTPSRECGCDLLTRLDDGNSSAVADRAPPDLCGCQGINKKRDVSADPLRCIVKDETLPESDRQRKKGDVYLLVASGAGV